jgi:uncharacterized protein (DUF58 family)
VIQVDAACPAIAAAFRKRNVRSARARGGAAKDPMFRKRGSSFDLKSIREYQYFDDPRAIDWRLYGRSDRAYVKEFYDEANERVALAVDASASIALVDQGEYRSCVASLCYLLTALGMGVTLRFYGSGGLSPKLDLRRRSDMAGLLERLKSLEPRGAGDSRKAYQALRSLGGERRVIMVSDFHEEALRFSPPPGGFLALIRFRVPLERLAAVGGELELSDPETGARLIQPWDEAERRAWWAAEKEREAMLAAMGPQARYYRRDPGQERESLYWDLLERLYA